MLAHSGSSVSSNETISCWSELAALCKAVCPSRGEGRRIISGGREEWCGEGGVVWGGRSGVRGGVVWGGRSGVGREEWCEEGGVVWGGRSGGEGGRREEGGGRVYVW